MAKLHWSPWMALSEIRAEAEGIALEPAGMKEAAYAWQPVADVMETAEDFRVVLELPGVAREDVSVEARGRFLVVEGRRAFEKDACGVYQILERSYGPFCRRFALPKGVSRAEITAVMKDGVLEIVVPKVRPERLRRRIPIN
ncbi:heat shock protein Hsp20 [Solidesulfovibrio fructosivorans JJ]]|uniref:Heat shock protein Hsp20 n=1 Tax=Solidesulfovibrio fructosivorans JJ] TaxID=596151 RepID=E1K193_SOLFR|nr:Hsp20/alpha crystallin family protein [Solidesulfovibrio fructosivorans]EFL49579.1 heat shock protein Hsp20 [Solidesulfovibrio fructosivorans JJ]]